MKTKTNIMIVISLILIGMDQLTKCYIIAKPRLYMINDGYLFGIYGANRLELVLIINLSLVVAVVAFFFYKFYIKRCRDNILMDMFITLWLSSIISNTIDRVRFGGGIDFINAFGFYTNVADIYIDIGSVALVVELIINRRCDVKLSDFVKYMVSNVKKYWKH